MQKEQRKLLQRIRSKSQAKANLCRKEYLLKKRQLLQGSSKAERSYNDNKNRSIRVTPPSNFSFVENTVECIKVFEKLNYCLKKNRNVFFQFRDIEKVSDDAIVILMSVIQWFNDNGLNVIGDEPKNKDVCKKFERSGIANYVGGYITKRAVKGKNGIYSHNNVKVENELTHQLIGQAAETIWNEKRTCTGVQRVLIECMANTHDHANPKKEATHSWWLSISHDEDNKKVSFSFIDFGVGIFESIAKQKFTEKFKNFFLRMAGRHKNNADILKLILNGELKKSRTGSKNRGNGLPSIATALNRNQIDNLKIISNDVFADLKTGVFTTMEKQFSGTFVYWELHKDCQSKQWVQ